MTSPNPWDNEDLYEGIVLAGVKSPGKVTLSGHDRKINWDVKSGPSLAGASTTIKDIPPIEFTATFFLRKNSRAECAIEAATFFPASDSTVFSSESVRVASASLQCPKPNSSLGATRASQPKRGALLAQTRQHGGQLVHGPRPEDLGDREVIKAEA